MKKVFRTVVLFTTFALLATGCQKEEAEMITREQAITEVNSVYVVHYTIDGVQHCKRLHGEWNHADFIYSLFTMAEEGHSVSFYEESRVSQSLSKETVTYTTSDKVEAYNWAYAMELQGYMVSVSYNPDTNTFTCIAIR